MPGLRQRPLPGDYDLAHPQRFHARILDDVYPWAGELRTVVIAKGSMFALSVPRRGRLVAYPPTPVGVA